MVFLIIKEFVFLKWMALFFTTNWYELIQQNIYPVNHHYFCFLNLNSVILKTRFDPRQNKVSVIDTVTRGASFKKRKRKSIESELVRGGITLNTLSRYYVANFITYKKGVTYRRYQINTHNLIAYKKSQTQSDDGRQISQIARHNLISQ